MTDPPFDELASAHLDGATTPEEAARVEADPALRARVEELRRVREAVAAVPPVDATHRDAAIAAAVAAFGASELEPPVRNVTPLRPPRRLGRSPALRRALGAAAAVVLLALLVPLLGRLGTTSSDDSASSDSSGAALETADERAADQLQDGADPESSASAPSGSEDAAVGYLGAYADVDALVTAIDEASEREALAEALPQTATEGTVDARRCGPETGEDGSRVERAEAVVAGDVVVVVIHGRADGARTIGVYRAADCALLDEVVR